MNKFGSFNIKTALLIGGLLIAGVVIFYTQIIVQKIQDREKQIAQLYAKSLEYLANDNSEGGEYSFIFEEVVNQIDFPIIATDRDSKTATFYKNVTIDSTLPPDKLNNILLEQVKEISKVNQPIVVAYQDTIVLNYVYYGQSRLVTELKLLPYLEFVVAGMFVLIGYISFSYIKKHEQSNIWVGLSRETAHQLGTPLTSLMGWKEMLKTFDEQPPEYYEVVTEIENDIEKLNKIAGRFSKIGSQPILKEENLKTVIQKVANYFEKRIPTLVAADGTLKKKITVEFTGDTDADAKINRDLFEWVIENLMKNALDAIDKSTGKIGIDIKDEPDCVIVDVSDNGKGIDTKHKKDVFRPGYSTKQRGWGLGLSLAKRIVDDYHRGKLSLHSSILSEGTTFRIKLYK